MGRKRIDITGKRFGRWTVLHPTDLRSGSDYKWRCLCDCGNEKLVSSSSLKEGSSKSCGCFLVEKNTRHGLRGTRVYSIWAAILQRCNNPNNNGYPNYGGRGVKVCERWMKFENFYADMGANPGGMTVDRIDNDGDYCPENCRWATQKEQVQNRRNTRLFTYKDVSMVLDDWARKIGIKRSTLSMRIYSYGWSIEKALTTPVRKKGGVS